jgi:hypothetical protein
MPPWRLLVLLRERRHRTRQRSFFRPASGIRADREQRGSVVQVRPVNLKRTYAQGLHLPGPKHRRPRYLAHGRRSRASGRRPQGKVLSAGGYRPFLRLASTSITLICGSCRVDRKAYPSRVGNTNGHKTSRCGPMSTATEKFGAQNTSRALSGRRPPCGRLGGARSSQSCGDIPASINHALPLVLQCSAVDCDLAARQCG